MDLNNLINIKDSTGDPNEVYIGRAGHGHDGYFGNQIKKDDWCMVCGEYHSGSGGTLKCYESTLVERIKNDAEFEEKLKALDGKILVCFCKHKPSCHGSIMIKHINLLNNRGFKF